jgi:hypothetical protein
MGHQDMPVEHVTSKIDMGRPIPRRPSTRRKESERVKQPCGRHRAHAPLHDDWPGKAARTRGVPTTEHWLFMPAVTESEGRGGRSLVESAQTPGTPKDARDFARWGWH